MTFKPTHHEKNLERIEQLAPHTKELAKKWYEYCLEHKVDIYITETFRTKEKQAEYVKNGASQTSRSYHLVGQAIDFVPYPNGKPDYNLYTKEPYFSAIVYAKKLGFKWGGDWKSFLDRPHLEYHYKGYGTDKVETVKPVPKPAPVKKPSYKGVSVVDYLKLKNIDSSFTNRKKLATKYGIKGYEGTQEQNDLLLDKLVAEHG